MALDDLTHGPRHRAMAAICAQRTTVVVVVFYAAMAEIPATKPGPGYKNDQIAEHLNGDIE